MLMVLTRGFAKAGTASAITARRAKLRRSELEFMRVSSFPSQIESAAKMTSRGIDSVDTRARGRVAFPERHCFSWTNGRKDACHSPAAATAGFFLEDS